jgi:hypothetical protein
MREDLAMHQAIRQSTRILVPASLAAALLGGCAWQDPYPPTTGAVLGGSSSSRTVEYPAGRYQLYGAGTSSSPYYWVWVPAGSNPPTPPPLPTGRVAASTTEGRYQLYGDGTSSSPYYYVWVPAGTTVVAPPPPPRRP